MPDVVVFRKWKRVNVVIALFPEIPSDILGRYCESYEHVGQHGVADYHGVVLHSRPATPTESADLRRELESIGYKLRLINRASAVHHERRRALTRCS